MTSALFSPIDLAGLSLANRIVVSPMCQYSGHDGCGGIIAPTLAEDIVASGKADMIAAGRIFLDDPHWGWHAAKALGADVPRPVQYARAAPAFWAPAKI